MLSIKTKTITFLACLFFSCQLLAQSSPSPYAYTICSPVEGTPESGPECYDVSGYDPTNGGPYVTPNAYESIAVGQTIAGQANGLEIFDVDTDWYEIYLDGTEVVEVSLCANFYSILLIWDEPGNSYPSTIRSSPANNKYSVQFGDCGYPLPAGYYYFSIESQIYPLIPCGESAKYSVSVNYPCSFFEFNGESTTLLNTDPGSLICDNRLGYSVMVDFPGIIGHDYEIGSVAFEGGGEEEWGSQLEVNLISPNGTVLELFNDPDEEESNYFGVNFQDGFPNISTASAPFENLGQSYGPLGGSLNATFAGESVTGNWTFEVCDNSPDGIPLDFPVYVYLYLKPLIGQAIYCNSSLEAPVIDTPCPDDIILYGAQNVTWIPPTATDNCNSPVVTIDGGYPGDFFEVGTHTIRYFFKDFANLYTGCNFDIIIYPAVLPEIQINTYNLPPFCQGIQELYAKVGNINELAAPITYAWSHDLGTEQSVVATLNNTIYSVTVADVNGSSSVATYNVNLDMSNLLSAHVLIADDELEMDNSEVYGGGVGLMDADEDVDIHHNSHIYTFLEADYASIDGTSTVGNYIDGASTLVLPPFISNPYYDTNNVVVPFGSTMTLSGTNYGKITVMPNATLIFDHPNVYVNSLTTKSKATLVFNQSTNVMVRRRVNIGQRNVFNASNEEVIMYVGDNFKVGQGSDVKVDVFAQEDIKVNDSGAALFTNMTGLFISNDGVSSGDKVIWTWNVGCETNVSPAQLFAQINTGEVETATEAKVFTVYPNPTQGVFALGLKDYMDKNINVVLYNTLGKVVWQSQITRLETATLSIDLSAAQFSNGIYLLSVATEGKVETKRLVLNR